MHYLLRLLLTLMLLFLNSMPSFAAPPEADGDELISGYVTVVDERGVVVLETGHEVQLGDQYINEDDTMYEITAVEGALARCKTVGKNTSSIPPEAIFVQAPAGGGSKPLIAIYHSHSDESYIPNDGKPSEYGNGSVMLVGDAFSKKLTEIGYQTEHSKTLHDPHDANAYHRSRRTAMKLLQSQPAALFDVHRDSAPRKAYATTINGQPATKILLVVGRQNQNRQTTLDYARSFKAAADAKYRGLIRGIFIARGNYNQDLSPRALLLEMGTQYNNREDAERSAALFADIVPAVLGNPGGGGVAKAQAADDGMGGGKMDPGTGAPVPGGEGAFAPNDTAPGSDIFWIVAALVVGVIAFLFISTGSWQEAKSKLKNFVKYEFANFMGSRKKRKE